MTDFTLPIYTMIALMVVMFIVSIVIIVIVMALLVKAIRYSGNNNSNIQNHYDPYSMDETSSHCPRCNSAVTTEFCYCPKCGEPLKNKDNIVKMKVN